MKKIIVIFIIALAVKLVYLLFAWFSGYSPDLEVFKRNDSYWYETIAVAGHDKITPDQLGSCESGELKQSYYAFFPLYPLIIGLSIKLTGMPFTNMAFFYSLVFSLLLFLFFYKFIRRLFGSEEIAFNSTLILILSPFHYYFSVYYSEALFLCLLIGAFYSIDEKKMGLFSFMASLLVLVRPNGLFMLLPLFLFFIERNQSLSYFKAIKLNFGNFLSMLYFLIPVVVFTMYCVYLKIMTGDFFAYKTAQAGWCRETVLPWTPLIRSSNWMDYFNSGYFLFFSFIALYNLRKIPMSFSALIWINLFLPLIANSITSPRFISVVFVFSFLFGKMIYKTNVVLRTILFVVLFLLQLITFKFWLAGSVFSY